MITKKLKRKLMKFLRKGKSLKRQKVQINNMFSTKLQTTSKIKVKPSTPLLKSRWKTSKNKKKNQQFNHLPNSRLFFKTNLKEE